MLSRSKALINFNTFRLFLTALTLADCRSVSRVSPTDAPNKPEEEKEVFRHDQQKTYNDLEQNKGTHLDEGSVSDAAALPTDTDPDIESTASEEGGDYLKFCENFLNDINPNTEKPDQTDEPPENKDRHFSINFTEKMDLLEKVGRPQIDLSEDPEKRSAKMLFDNEEKKNFGCDYKEFLNKYSQDESEKPYKTMKDETIDITSQEIESVVKGNKKDEEVFGDSSKVLDNIKTYKNDEKSFNVCKFCIFFAILACTLCCLMWKKYRV